MGYILKSEYWLKSETDRVEGLILKPSNWSTTWEASSLQLSLKDQGLTYTVPQCQEILEELKERNVLKET